MKIVETVYAIGGNASDGWVVWSELWVGRRLISNQVMGCFAHEMEAKDHRDGLEAAYGEEERCRSVPSGESTDYLPLETGTDVDMDQPAYLCPNCGCVVTWGYDELGSCPRCEYQFPVSKNGA